MLLYSVWECTTLLSFAFGSQSFIFTLPSNLSVCTTGAWHSMRQHGWVKGTCRSGLECQFKRGNCKWKRLLLSSFACSQSEPNLAEFSHIYEKNNSPPEAGLYTAAAFLGTLSQSTSQCIDICTWIFFFTTQWATSKWHTLNHLYLSHIKYM